MASTLDSAGSQQHRRGRRERDDRAFDADFARAAIEDQVHRIAQVVRDMSGGRRRYVAEAVRRWRGDAVAEFREKRARHRMRRRAQADARLAAGDGVGHVACARHDQRQRPRPEGAGQRARLRWNGRRPSLGSHDVGHVHDHGMIGRPPLRFEDASDGDRVARVRAESVHGFRGKRDELPVGQQSRSVANRRAVGGANVHRHSQPSSNDRKWVAAGARLTRECDAHRLARRYRLHA